MLISRVVVGMPRSLSLGEERKILEQVYNLSSNKARRKFKCS
jgi:hypothetical protein